MRIRELRAEARNALKGNLMKITLPIFLTSILVYMSIIFLYQQIQLVAGSILFDAFLEETQVVQSHFREEVLLIIFEILLVIAVFVLPFFFNFGITINTIKISRNEKSNFFKEIFSKKNIRAFLCVWWGLVKRNALWISLIILSLIGITSYSGILSMIPNGIMNCIVFISLLMIIIVTYRYMLVYYLKYDYPDKPTKELFAKSRLMMIGNKAKAVVIPLTLIGWYFLNYLVTWGITMLLNLIWLPEGIAYYDLSVSVMPIWASIVVDIISNFLSSMLAAYLYMINYQLYMEQKPLELYNGDYLKPKTNAKKYIWILIAVFVGYILLIGGTALMMYMTVMKNIL